jgi:tRNA (guanine-N7-)-methyltransferase
MARKKLHRFEAFSQSPHGFEFAKEQNGSWQDVFADKQPLILELGCGRGEYTIALATAHPEYNVIGMDIQGERLWYGIQHIESKKLTNAKFLRGYIDHLPEYFSKEPIDAIWITFPDPQPRDRNIKKRLTNPRFQAYYQALIGTTGTMHLKTDSDLMYAYTKEILEEYPNIEIICDIPDIDLNPDIPEILRVSTYFERKFRAKGSTIKYLSWKFTAEQ